MRWLYTVGDRPRNLAALFLAQTSITMLLLAILVPPFENSDEFNHFNRADQIASGGLLAIRYNSTTSGGLVDRGIDQVDNIIGTIRFHPERKVTGEMLRQAAAIGWGGRAPTDFANTSIYAPMLYAPAVVGVLVGKALGLSVTRTLIISRALTGFSALLPAAFAIALSDEAAPLLLVLLTLPMSLSLFAAVSQDGPMLAAAALTVGFVGRAARSIMALVCLCACLALLGIARPAYLPFAIMPLLLSGLRQRHRLMAVVSIMLPILAWWALAALTTMVNTSSSRGVDTRRQLVGLLHNPELVPLLAWHALTLYQGMEGRSFFVEFIGMLGWIDVALPPWFYWAAGVALLLAMSAAMARPIPPMSLPAQGMLSAAILVAVAAIFLLEYVTWTPVGLPIIEGVQGRYFLPVALVLVLCLPVLRHPILHRLTDLIRLLLICFPTVSVIVTVSTVVRRYYL